MTKRDTVYGGAFRDSKISMDDHDRFVRSNKMLAEADKPLVSRTASGQAITEKTCRNCGLYKSCKKNRVKQREGVASVGGDANTIYKCKEWTPQEDQTKGRQKKNKSLLKQFKRLNQ